MIRSKATHTTLAAMLILLAASCAGNGLSDGSSADVVLQNEQMQTSPVSATPETGTGTCSISGSGCTINADCPLVGEQCQGASGCKLTATEWNVSFRNEPKNTSAESPATLECLISFTARCRLQKAREIAKLATACLWPATVD